MSYLGERWKVEHNVFWITDSLDEDSFSLFINCLGECLGGGFGDPVNADSKLFEGNCKTRLEIPMSNMEQ
jgi:hypothetical protein